MLKFRSVTFQGGYGLVYFGTVMVLCFRGFTVNGPHSYGLDIKGGYP